MENTLNPEEIYAIFDKAGFPILRIDNFYRGDYAEVRTELKYENFLTLNNLQEITLKLKALERNENISIEIVDLNMLYKTLRLNFKILKQEKE